VSGRGVIAVLAGIVVIVAAIAAVTANDGDGGFGAGVGQAPSPTATTKAPQPAQNVRCETPRIAVLERIGGHTTDLVDFTPAHTVAAPGGRVVASAPVRPAVTGAAIATWVVSGANVSSANATARDHSSFASKSVPSSDRAAVAHAEACVRAGLTSGDSP
jgi:hypothetical protein